MGLGSDKKGDRYQNGGILIMNPDGHAIYMITQTKEAWHIENETVLQVN